MSEKMEVGVAELACGLVGLGFESQQKNEKELFHFFFVVFEVGSYKIVHPRKKLKRRSKNGY
jgi:hypothetical protein